MQRQSAGQQNSSVAAVKSGVWFTVCHMLTKTVGFLTTPIFARILTKAEFGDYNNFHTWIGIFLYVTSLNLDASLIRAKYDYKDELDDYISSMVCLSMISTVTWYGVTLLLISTVEKLTLMSQFEIHAMFLYLLFYPAIQIFQTRERYHYRYKTNVFVTLLYVIGTALLSVILVMLMQNKLTGRIIGTIIPVAIIGFVLAFLIFRKSFSIKTKYWKYALPFTLPFIPHLLSMFLLGSMDKVMIKQICGSEDLAKYSLAYTVGTIISLLVSSMNNAFSPWLSEQLNGGQFDKSKKVSVPYVAFFALAAVMGVLITPEVLLIIGGEGYLEAKHVVPQVFAGCVMQFVYCMYVNVEQFYKKTVGMAIASVSSALFNFVTNYIFIRQYGYNAASYTTFFSYLLLMILHVFIVKKLMKMNVFKDLYVILIAGVTAALLIASNLIIDMFIVRYILFAVLFVIFMCIAYKNRQIALKFLKRK